MKNGVKNMQASAYNGERTVYDFFISVPSDYCRTLKKHKMSYFKVTLLDQKCIETFWNQFSFNIKAGHQRLYLPWTISLNFENFNLVNPKGGFKSEGRGGFFQLPKMSAEKTFLGFKKLKSWLFFAFRGLI